MDDEVGTGQPQQFDESGNRREASPADRHHGRTGTRPRFAARGAWRVLAIPNGSNQAISNAMVVVESLISLSRPPMIPPTPIGVSLASQINRSSVVKRALDTVERDHRLAVGRAAHPETAAAQRVEVVRVVGLVELEHDVVADVDDVVDRTHSRGSQTMCDPVRATARRARR